MRSSLFALAHADAERSEPAARRLTDPCGKFLPALVYHDLRDRLHGRGERANARWGAIDRPNAPGKLVWVAAGSSRESVRLGVELARAILAPPRRQPDAHVRAGTPRAPRAARRLEPGRVGPCTG